MWREENGRITPRREDAKEERSEKGSHQRLMLLASFFLLFLGDFAPWRDPFDFGLTASAGAPSSASSSAAAATSARWGRWPPSPCSLRSCAVRRTPCPLCR